MAHMFDSCTSLTEVKNLPIVNAKDISYLFYNCYSLTVLISFSMKLTLIIK